MMPRNEQPHAGTTLACSLGAMTMAGTIYWLPALGVALAPVLSLSSADTAAMVTAANGTAAVLFLAGLMHQAIGPARTAIVGSFVLAGTYAGVAQVVLFNPARPLPFLIIAGVLVSLSSYSIYASAQATAVAAFPITSRGAVNGLMSSVYAMSSGVCGALQAAFFPAADADTVVAMLRAMAVIALIPAFCALVAFPHVLDPVDGDKGGEIEATRDEDSGLVCRLLDAAEPPMRNQCEFIRYGYVVAIAVGIVLQLCAFVDWQGNVVWFDGRVRAELALALVLLPVLALLGLPALLGRRHEPLIRRVHDAGTLEVSESAPFEVEASERSKISPGCSQGPPTLTFFELLVDRRFFFVAGSVAVLGGCGGVTLLNTSETLVASRLLFPPQKFRRTVAPFALASTAKITSSVRAIVMVFSATNVAGRLFGGHVADEKDHPQSADPGSPSSSSPADGPEAYSSSVERRYRILQLNAMLLVVGMSICAVTRSWWLFFGASIVGFCYGIFYSTIPALLQDLCGIQSFPRDFAVCGVANGLLSVLIASGARLVSDHVGADSWVDIAHGPGVDAGSTKYCLGLVCSLPVYLTCGLISVLFVALSVRYRSYILRAASRQ